eukprot:2269831-Prymnesium_polylepis.1
MRRAARWLVLAAAHAARPDAGDARLQPLDASSPGPRTSSPAPSSPPALPITTHLPGKLIGHSSGPVARRLPETDACPKSRTAAEAVVGWLGTLMAGVLFLAPVSVMRQVLRAADVRNFSPTPYLMTAVSCGMWVVYAQPWVTPCKPQVLATSIFGSVLE